MTVNVGESANDSQQNGGRQVHTNGRASGTPSPQAEAQAYLDHLLAHGHEEEQDESSEMQLPPYYDAELFKKGQNSMRYYRFVITSGMLSGLIAVLAIPSILKVLICTKQSGNAAMAYKRYVRTILHTLTWYDSPLKVGSKSWQSISAVRKAHNRSSKMCMRSQQARISQKDLALTQFGFIGFVCLGTEDVGIYDDEFLESTVHMWRVIGYLLGIRDEFNICTDSWKTTKARLEVVRDQVYKPALENTQPDFEEMAKVLIDGLWAYSNILTLGSYLYFTKRLARCDGYKYYDFDAAKKPADLKDPYNELGWWDRFLVSYGLFFVTYLHPFALFRNYINFRVWCSHLLSYYLPYLAVFKFGPKWAYVRIFTGNEGHEQLNGKAHAE